MKEMTDFNSGISYIIFKLEKAYQASDRDPAIFGAKALRIMNQEQLREAYEEEENG